jgi:hypothetical protein
MKIPAVPASKERMRPSGKERMTRAAVVERVRLPSAVAAAQFAPVRPRMRRGKDRAPRPDAGVPGAEGRSAPMENLTNDLSASDNIRDAFAQGVAERGYAVLPLLESDQALGRPRISYGGSSTTTRRGVQGARVEGFSRQVQESARRPPVLQQRDRRGPLQLYGKTGRSCGKGRTAVHPDVVRGEGEVWARSCSPWALGTSAEPADPHREAGRREHRRKVPGGRSKRIS